MVTHIIPCIYVHTKKKKKTCQMKPHKGKTIWKAMLWACVQSYEASLRWVTVLLPIFKQLYYQIECLGLDVITLWILRGKRKTVKLKSFHSDGRSLPGWKRKMEMSQQNIFAGVWFRGWTESQDRLFILLSWINLYLIVDGDSFSSQKVKIKC